MWPSYIFVPSFKRTCLLAVAAAITLSAPDSINAAGQSDHREFDPMGYPTHIEDYDGDGYTTAQGDCDDVDPLEYPGQRWYKDLDNDGFSDGTFLISCLRPASYKVAAELSRITGDINDRVPDPQLASFPVINSIQPTMLMANNRMTIRGSSFGSFRGSAYVNFFQGVEAVTIVAWNTNTIVCEVPPAAQNGCIQIVTVMGKSNCVEYTIVRPMSWLLLLTSGPAM